MVFRRLRMMHPELHTVATIWAVCQEDVRKLVAAHAVVEATHDPAWRQEVERRLLLLAGHGLDSKCEEERVGCLSQNATDISDIM